MRGITPPSSRPHRRCRQSQRIESMAFTDLTWRNKHYRQRNWSIATSYDLLLPHHQRRHLAPPPSDDDEDDEDDDDEDNEDKDNSNEDDKDRGCTPEFSCAKAKIRVLVPCRQHTRNKIMLAGQATSHPPPPLYRRNHTRPPHPKLTPAILLSPHCWGELAVLATQSQGDITCACDCEARIVSLPLPAEKKYCRQHKNTATMAMLPLSSAEVSPRDK